MSTILKVFPKQIFATFRAEPQHNICRGVVRNKKWGGQWAELSGDECEQGIFSPSRDGVLEG